MIPIVEQVVGTAPRERPHGLKVHREDGWKVWTTNSSRDLDRVIRRSGKLNEKYPDMEWRIVKVYNRQCNFENGHFNSMCFVELQGRGEFR